MKASNLFGLVVGCFIISTSYSFAQPANDNCATAQVISIPASGSICLNGTNLGATSDLTTNSCDTGAPGNEVWYTYIAEGGQNVVTITPNGGTPASSVVVSLQSTACGSGVFSTCASAVGAAAATGTFSFPIGTQVTFAVETNGTDGTFQVCVSSTTQPAAPGNSCSTATPICNKNPFTLSPFPLNSNVITPACFPSPFQQPVFYQFTVGTSGTCIWAATPTAIVEYDWVMYDITAGCPGIEVCCNFNYAGMNDIAPVGMSATAPNSCGTAGFDENPYELSPPANVVAGNTYLIVIDNYSNSNVGFNFTWGGTFQMAPNPNLTATPSTGCAPLNVSITNTSTASVSYVWNFDNGSTSTATSPPAQTYSTPGTYLISLVATSTSGCQNATSQVITVNEQPVMNPVANQAFCAGATAPSTVLSTSTAGAVTFSWTNSNPAIGLSASGSGNVPSFTATNSGSSPITATISVTATSSGCTSVPTTYTVTVNPVPTITPITSISQCVGTTIAASSFNSAVTGTTFTWSNSNTAIGLGASGTGNTPSFTGTNTTASTIIGTITVTPTSPAGCVGTAVTFTISITPQPSVTTPTNITQCPGSVPAINFTTNPVGATLNWTNSNTSIGLGASGTGNIASFTGTNSSSSPITGTIAVTPSLGGCTGTPVNFTITINTVPIISPVTDVFGCDGVAIPAINFTVNPGSVTPTWTNSNTAIGLGASGSGDIASFTGTNSTSSPISGTITLNAIAGGCNAIPVTFTITIAQSPTMAAIAPITQCAGTTVAASNFVSVPAGATFSWTNSDPSIGLGASGTGNTASFTASNSGTTSVTSTVTVTPAFGSCIGTPDDYTITINPIPVPTATNTSPICEGTTLNFNSSGGTTYSWTGPNSFTSSVQNPSIATVTLAAVGTYTVTVTSLGCSATATTDVTITPNTQAVITQAGPFCADENPINLVATIPGGTWSGTGITDAVTGTFSPTAASTGNNVITYTIPGMCTAPSTSTIVVNPIPIVDFSASDLIGCEPFTTTFTDLTVPSSTSVSWDFGDGGNSTALGSIQHTYAQAGTYTVSLTSTSGGCSATHTIQDYIQVLPKANASFNVSDVEQTELNPVFNCFNTSTDATIYSWSFGDGSQSSTTSPVHTYSGESGNYVIELVANNIGNCPDTARITVAIKGTLIYYVPNTFTPDGDEYNNTFCPVFYSGFDPQSFELTIYNRWGEIMFESKNVEIGWDGTYMGNLCKEGVFTWTVQFRALDNDKKYTDTGHLLLLK